MNWLLIAASVALYVWSNQGENQERLLPWFISLESARSAHPLREVLHGEIWRLFSPAFIHSGLYHIGFNMLNLISLGNILERRVNSWNYLALVAGLAMASDLTQYFFTGNPDFGGMSGVVYGLIGYIWMRGRSDQTFGLAIPQQMVVIAFVWFFACVVGIIHHVANAAHAGGLIVGMLWGISDARGAMQRARLRA